MRKNLFVLFCFISIICYSQDYHFDYFIVRESTRIKPNKIEWTDHLFYDSKSGVALLLMTHNKKMRAYIYEQSKDRRHSFKVNQKKDLLSFEYTHTNNFGNEKKIRDAYKNDEFKITKVDSLHYEIIVFKDKKMKSKRITIMVGLEKSDFNYLNINADYGRCEEVENELAQLLGTDKYMIKETHLEYSGGYIFDKSIVKTQKIDLNLKVPEKLVVKEYDHWAEFD
ncbi:hypothetical protein [Chryseobacterium defluvii]|uniref:Uncharacterized protein n=1 Tax=Chryseobacterium defluvii TaxID=160396 RepID=A0A495SNJ8_9FLAO|nr:hypothetical protein [Chryseobacterium defluvii]RKT01646.1 hypothetical protein BCF58_0869 [Chryseobacterium defluvii]